MIKPEQVLAYRRSLNMTQVQFAEHCGVSLSTLRSGWEENGIPTKDLKKSRAVVEIEEAIRNT